MDNLVDHYVLKGGSIRYLWSLSYLMIILNSMPASKHMDLFGMRISSLHSEFAIELSTMMLSLNLTKRQRQPNEAMLINQF